MLVLNKIDQSDPNFDKKYIGQTGDVIKRTRAHKSKNSRCTQIATAIQKYGLKSFTIIILKQCSTREMALQYECQYINWYQTSLLSHGFNSSIGEVQPGNISTQFNGTEMITFCRDQNLYDTARVINHVHEILHVHNEMLEKTAENPRAEMIKQKKAAHPDNGGSTDEFVKVINKYSNMN